MAARSKALRLLLAILIAVLGLACGGEKSASLPTADGDGETMEQDADGDSASSKPSRLHAAGKRIVNAEGQEVLLKGVNLGGWAYLETWISLIDYSLQARAYQVGVKLGLASELETALKSVGAQRKVTLEVIKDEAAWRDDLRDELSKALAKETLDAYFAALESVWPGVYDDSDKPIMRTFENRFGISGRDELMDTWMRAWITENDIKWLAEQGFNLLRVPVGYRILTSGSHLADKPTDLTWNENAFSRLNDLFDWCAKYGLYAVLDIQESPGGQNNYSGEATLYSDPAMQALTVQLWQELSRRFKNRDEVAAYSLLAEPMSAPDNEARDTMYDSLVKAIRAQGDDHLLVIHDGFKGMNSLPLPSKYGWDNVIYSTHLFEWNAKSKEDYETIISLIYKPGWEKAQAKHNVPYFIGSFSAIWDTEWAYESVDALTGFFNAHSWSWSLWTLKRLDCPIESKLWGTRSQWGLLGRMDTVFERPDVFADDLATLKKKLAAYATLPLSPNTELLRRLKTAL